MIIILVERVRLYTMMDWLTPLSLRGQSTPAGRAKPIPVRNLIEVRQLIEVRTRCRRALLYVAASYREIELTRLG